MFCLYRWHLEQTNPSMFIQHRLWELIGLNCPKHSSTWLYCFTCCTSYQLLQLFWLSSTPFRLWLKRRIERPHPMHAKPICTFCFRVACLPFCTRQSRATWLLIRFSQFSCSFRYSLQDSTSSGVTSLSIIWISEEELQVKIKYFTPIIGAGLAIIITEIINCTLCFLVIWFTEYKEIFRN